MPKKFTNPYAYQRNTHTTQIHSLLLKVHQARVVLTQRTSASHSHPPPVSLPSTPTSPTPPTTIAGRKRCEVDQLVTNPVRNQSTLNLM